MGPADYSNYLYNLPVAYKIALSCASCAAAFGLFHFIVHRGISDLEKTSNEFKEIEKNEERIKQKSH